MTATATAPRRARNTRSGIRRGEALAGWIFVLPVILILGVFLLIPVLMALWVSVSDWSGRGSPFSSNVGFVGLQNYAAVTTGDGLATRDFGTAMRNNTWYVLLVVPLQTALSLFLAVLVNGAVLRGRGFFRTAFYFPSVTASVAITVLCIFLFSTTGVVNEILGAIGINGPTGWPIRGASCTSSSAAWASPMGRQRSPESGFLGLSWWNWLAGPSVAMRCSSSWRSSPRAAPSCCCSSPRCRTSALRFRRQQWSTAPTPGSGSGRVTLPQLKPALFTVLTLGLIGCWQVFDQIYTGTQGEPAKTTLTPAYLSYHASFLDQDWGQGAAIAFILFAIIVFFTLFQRWVLRDRPVSARRARQYAAAHAARDGQPGDRGVDQVPSPPDPARNRPRTTVKARRRGHDRHEHRPGTDGAPQGPPAPRTTSRLVAARRRSAGRSRSTRCSSSSRSIYIYPFLVQVSTSFKTDAEAARQPGLADSAGLVDGGL